MPADPITPSRAAAWDNTAPDSHGVLSRFSCVVRAQSNIASLAPTAGIIDNVSLAGSLLSVSERAVLLSSQTDATQNGIYVAAAYGSNLALPSNFSVGGQAVKTGLTLSRLYLWTKSNGTSITNGTITLTESGFIVPDLTGQLTINGPASAAVSDTLTECQLSRHSLFNAGNEFPSDLVVSVSGGTNANTWWVLSSPVSIIGSSQISFSQLTVSSRDVGYEDDAWDNTAPTAITPSRAVAFDDTVPGGKTPANAVAFDNTAPDGKTPANAAAWDNTAPTGATVPRATAWDNTAPAGKTPANATAWDNTAPGQSDNGRLTPWNNGLPETIILVGTQPSTGGATLPASPTAATESTTLVAGTNYMVQVGARLNPVTVNLPDPGSLIQRIEIADVGNLAAAYPITVNGGTKDIESSGVKTYVMNRPGSVLTLSYTGTYWKIV